MSGPKTATKLFSVLELVRTDPGLRLSELAKRLNMSVPTCSRLLESLTEGGLVVRRGSRFELGPYCLSLGEAFRSGFDLGRDARPMLERLSAATGETSHLGVADGLACVYIDKVDSPQSIRMHSQIGRRTLMHCTGMGKALLSGLPPATTEAVIAAGLSPRTPMTITDPDLFRAEIELTRQRGYAIDDVENEPGIRCVAAPVLGRDGLAVAAVSVAGPETRLPLERLVEFVEPLREVATALSDRL